MLGEQGRATMMAEAKAIFQGMLLRDLAGRAEELLGHPVPPDWIDEFEHRRATRFEQELRPIAGAGVLIEALLGAGLPICVASQGQLEKTRRSLALTGLAGYFPEHTRFSAYQVPRGKPYPDLFLFAAARMGFAPEACAVIEDSPSGATAARRAGMEVYGYAAETDAGELERIGARTVRSLTELVPVLTGAREV